MQVDTKSQNCTSPSPSSLQPQRNPSLKPRIWRQRPAPDPAVVGKGYVADVGSASKKNVDPDLEHFRSSGVLVGDMLLASSLVSIC